MEGILTGMAGWRWSSRRHGIIRRSTLSSGSSTFASAGSAVRVEEYLRRRRAKLGKGDAHRAGRELRLDECARDVHLHVLGGLLAERRLAVPAGRDR